MGACSRRAVSGEIKYDARDTEYGQGYNEDIAPVAADAEPEYNADEE
jgi:hypothetical protein